MSLSPWLVLPSVATPTSRAPPVSEGVSLRLSSPLGLPLLGNNRVGFLDRQLIQKRRQAAPQASRGDQGSVGAKRGTAVIVRRRRKNRWRIDEEERMMMRNIQMMVKMVKM
eukprot:7563639-Pyramimonas_sp.AAC.1